MSHGRILIGISYRLIGKLCYWIQASVPKILILYYFKNFNAINNNIIIARLKMSKNFKRSTETLTLHKLK